MKWDFRLWISIINYNHWRSKKIKTKKYNFQFSFLEGKLCCKHSIMLKSPFQQLLAVLYFKKYSLAFKPKSVVFHSSRTLETNKAIVSFTSWIDRKVCFWHETAIRFYDSIRLLCLFFFFQNSYHVVSGIVAVAFPFLVETMSVMIGVQ